MDQAGTAPGIAGYPFLRTLGRGGMGVVHASTHPVTGEPVAVKVVLRRLREHPEIRERFRREIEAMSRVEHPALVRVLDSGEEDGQAFYVMEMVTGRDLSLHLQEVGALDPEGFRRVARGIFSALARLHEAGVLHRDLKPQNIMLSDQGEPKIMDFGLTKVRDMETMTRTGTHLGSPRYLAPEMLEGKRLDARSDLYQAGLVLWECGARQAVHHGDDLQTVMTRILTADRPSLAALRPDLPLSMVDAIEGCLVLDREERLQTGDQVLEVLEGKRSLEEVLRENQETRGTRTILTEEGLLEPAGGVSERTPEEAPGEAPEGDTPAGIPTGSPHKNHPASRPVPGPPPASLRDLLLGRVLPGMVFLVLLAVGFLLPDRFAAEEPREVQIHSGLDRVVATWRGPPETPVQLVIETPGGGFRRTPPGAPQVIPPDPSGIHRLVIEGLPPGEILRASLRFPGGSSLPREVTMPPGLFDEGFPRLVGLPGGGIALRAELQLPAGLEVGYRGEEPREVSSPRSLSHEIELPGLSLGSSEYLEVRCRDDAGSRVLDRIPRDLLLERAGAELVRRQRNLGVDGLLRDLAASNRTAADGARIRDQCKLPELVSRFAPLAEAFLSGRDVSRPGRIGWIDATERLRLLAFALREVGTETTPSPSELLRGPYARGPRPSWESRPLLPPEDLPLRIAHPKLGSLTGHGTVIRAEVPLPPLPSPRPETLSIGVRLTYPNQPGSYFVRMALPGGPTLHLLEGETESPRILWFHRQLDTRDLPRSGGSLVFTFDGVFSIPMEHFRVRALTWSHPPGG